ncbi:MAG: hypothetical protein J7518_21350 [Nocardioidaceae bacterium]|nr:hypothetical protein [Nocardioidaceae bacterium]
MRFLAGAVVALTMSVGAVAAPAEAAVSISLRADHTTLMSGSTVVLSGRSPAARVGRVVVLQRRFGGAWSNVARRTLGPTHSYRFVVRPPRGTQLYRVFAPRSQGQPAASSRPVTLSVRWTPVVRTTVSAVLRPGNVWATRVTGVTVPLVALWSQRWDPGTSAWVDSGDLAAVAGPDGRFSLERVEPQRFRLTVRPSGSRLAGYSATLSVLQPPIPLVLDDATRIEHVLPDAEGVVPLSVTATAGTLISVTGRSEVFGPDGGLVVEEMPDTRDITSFRALSTGTYTLRWHPLPITTDPVEIWATTPKVVGFDVAGLCCRIQQDLPGQVVEARLLAQSGDLVVLDQSIYPSSTDGIGLRVFLDPAGSPLQPDRVWDNTDTQTSFFRIATSGSYTLRYLPRSTTSDMSLGPDLSLAPTTDLVMGAEPTWVRTTTIPGVARARFSAVAGQTVLLTMSEFGEVLSPSGLATNVFGPQQCLPITETGTHDLLVVDDNLVSVEVVRACPHGT